MATSINDPDKKKRMQGMQEGAESGPESDPLVKKIGEAWRGLTGQSADEKDSADKKKKTY